ncbi:MAG: riboflavin synthase [Gemmatimonadaceae bacterium]|nr:riboflavin synthase [Gemmatimonadaceae bacterium]
MFTGLIQAVGDLVAVGHTPAGRELQLRAPFTGIVGGESIACDGVCLTVREYDAQSFTVSAVGTTLERTTIGTWAVGRKVNLERALKVGDALGGHFVQGHVEGSVPVTRAEQVGDAWILEVAVPPEIDALLIPQGSVAIDGVSLTVNALPRPGVLELSIIEYTARHTTLGARVVGDLVHIETDLLARHVARLREVASPAFAR